MLSRKEGADLRKGCMTYSCEMVEIKFGSEADYLTATLVKCLVMYLYSA